MKKKIKLFVVPAVYALAISVFGLSLYLAQRIFNNNSFSELENMEYVDKEIVTDNEYIPVVAEEVTIMKPFMNEEVKLNKTFYNYQDETKNQENSIIIYQDTYIQNSGVDYTYTESFDVVSILDGTVIEVTNNEILGNTVKIRHSNDLISVYQSLSDVSVKVDDMVLRGQIIAKSGTCNLYPKDYNLHFEMAYQGKNINPEENYNKKEFELQA